MNTNSQTSSLPLLSSNQLKIVTGDQKKFTFSALL